MKKLIATVLASAVTLCGVSAFAQSRTVEMVTALSTDEIHIIYNDSVVHYDDVKPVNRNDRVMIPFRAALETMGANVDYDDATRTVTATKDDTTISFVLMDDTINIDKNGEKSQITMDAPMIIENDRTLVPIRFMSNALGMQVGWDGNSETVVIADYDNFVDEFAAKAPNLFKLASLSDNDLTKNTMEFTADIDTTGEKGSFKSVLSGKSDATQKDNKGQEAVTFSVTGGKYNIENTEADIITEGTNLYIKTNAVKEIADKVNDVQMKAAALLFDENTWYKIDLVKVLKSMGVDTATADAIAAAANAPKSESVEKSIMSGVKTEGDATLEYITNLSTMLDMYEALDKHISVSATDTGYSVQVDITPDEFIGIINASLDNLMTEDDRAEMLKNFNCALKADITREGNVQKSIINADFNVISGGETMRFKLDLTNDATVEENVGEITVPGDSADITDILIMSLAR